MIIIIENLFYHLDQFQLEVIMGEFLRPHFSTLYFIQYKKYENMAKKNAATITSCYKQILHCCIVIVISNEY